MMMRQRRLTCGIPALWTSANDSAVDAALVERLQPLVAEAYQQLAGESNTVSLAYDPQWRHEGLAALSPPLVVMMFEGVCRRWARIVTMSTFR